MEQVSLEQVYYLAVKPFDTAKCEKWRSYTEWLGRNDLRELITLDATLCERVISDLTDEDWKHNVHEEWLQEYFLDIDYLLSRIGSSGPVNVFATVCSPEVECRDALNDSRFTFAGYDIMDREAAISLILNCGDLDQAFSKGELSETGLFATLAEAKRVKGNLTDHYATDPHVLGCSVWAVWKMNR